MAAVLVVAGLWLHAGVGKAATSVTRGQAIAIAFAGRRTLREARLLSQPVLQEVMDELSAQGLRYVEVSEPDQKGVLSAGKHQPAHWLKGEQHGPVGSIAFDREGANARPQHGPVVSIAFDREGANARLQMTLDVPASADSPTATAAVSPRQGGEVPVLKKQIVFEVESIMARKLAWRAEITFAVSLLAAAALLGLCAVFWRISRHAERASLQLERDRQLKVLGQMSAVLGHEIKNPLASLKGHVQLLLEKLPADHPGRKGAEVVLRETIRLEELSRHVLEFARTGSVQCEEADPSVVVRTAVESAGGPDARVEIRSAPREWRMDSRRMEEVLVNLLRNAREASAPGQPIDVVVEGGPDNLLIEVRDRGEGIVPGEEQRVFEPFYTRRPKGTGLGLALARRIVEGHGGTISARNHPGGGAVFSVVLPPRTEGA
jgi:two-component system, NtrC family, sensor histidine kinase HydH